LAENEMRRTSGLCRRDSPNLSDRTSASARCGYEDVVLQFAGKVGTGRRWTDAVGRAMRTQFENIEVMASPFRQGRRERLIAVEAGVLIQTVSLVDNEDIEFVGRRFHKWARANE
jgi:hypothetical protein